MFGLKLVGEMLMKRQWLDAVFMEYTHWHNIGISTKVVETKVKIHNKKDKAQQVLTQLECGLRNCKLSYVIGWIQIYYWSKQVLI